MSLNVDHEVAPIMQSYLISNHFKDSTKGIQILGKKQYEQKIK